MPYCFPALPDDPCIHRNRYRRCFCAVAFYALFREKENHSRHCFVCLITEPLPLISSNADHFDRVMHRRTLPQITTSSPHPAAAQFLFFHSSFSQPHNSIFLWPEAPLFTRIVIFASPHRRRRHSPTSRDIETKRILAAAAGAIVGERMNLHPERNWNEVKTTWFGDMTG